MKTALIVLGSFAAGALVAALFSPNEGKCCHAVGQAVRDKVGDKFGPAGQAVGDLLGAWGPAGSFVSNLGLT